MISKTIIFDSSLNLYQYLIANKQFIKELFLFEDNLNNTIYISGFLENNIFITIQKPILYNFNCYDDIYNFLGKNFTLYIYKVHNKTLKLTR